jgi:hypothetical protein
MFRLSFGCPILAVLNWLSYPDCPVLVVLSWLSCRDCPVLTVRMSCLGNPVLSLCYLSQNSQETLTLTELQFLSKCAARLAKKRDSLWNFCCETRDKSESFYEILRGYGKSPHHQLVPDVGGGG